MRVQKTILAAPHVIHTDLSFDEISEEECYIKGVLTLNGGCELHVAEYVVTEPEIRRIKYRFHLQAVDQKMIARWDNAPHHPEVETHPDHLHVGQKVKAHSPTSIDQVLSATLSFIE
jgi:hypothetical protein